MMARPRVSSSTAASLSGSLQAGVSRPEVPLQEPRPNDLHWVRDATTGDDASKLRSASGTRALATVRHLAISVLRIAGVTNIAQALRQVDRRPTLGLGWNHRHPKLLAYQIAGTASPEAQPADTTQRLPTTGISGHADRKASTSSPTRRPPTSLRGATEPDKKPSGALDNKSSFMDDRFWLVGPA